MFFWVFVDGGLDDYLFLFFSKFNCQVLMDFNKVDDSFACDEMLKVA